MSAATTALDRFERWLDAEDDGEAVATFRRVFAAIWVVYDVIDLALGDDRALARLVPARPRSQARRPPGGARCERRRPRARPVRLGLGHDRRRGARRPRPSSSSRSTTSSSRRSCTCSWRTRRGVRLPGDVARRASGRRPRWVRDALIVQFGWIYVATGVLKLNPDWLDGGQLFVRTQYLAISHGWPYPEALSRAFTSLAFDAKLSEGRRGERDRARRDDAGARARTGLRRCWRSGSTRSAR